MKISSYFIAAIFSFFATNASFAQDQVYVDTNGSLKVENPQKTTGPQPPAQPQTQAAPANTKALAMPSNLSNTGQSAPMPAPSQPGKPAGNQPSAPQSAPIVSQPLPPTTASPNPVYPGGVTNPGGPR